MDRRPTSSELLDRSSIAFDPRAIDHWIAASWLQKAIRRGDLELAEQAASHLHRFRGANALRRLLIVAFEDIGMASIETVSSVVDACRQPPLFRDQDIATGAVSLSRLLAAAPSDRSADFLISAINRHPAFGDARTRVKNMKQRERLALIADSSASLHERGAATLYASGLIEPHGRSWRTHLDEALTTFKDLGVPAQFIDVVRCAAWLEREPLTIVLPLLWLALRSERPKTVVTNAVPETKVVCGVPLYAFDKHTRLGKLAVQRFARENSDVRRVLETCVAKNQRPGAACMAAFYADGAPVSRRLVWPDSERIEKLGHQADLFHVGVPLEAAEPLTAAVTSNLDHLNDVRERLLLRHLRASL
ncbi:hypothetical protein [Hyphomicrobium sp. DY-1]|uniref:hypothetical protein n=1 Tax=Hyphomicrobium sp. DY-1 TaxID=3075650 RepID=UPI0039C3BE5E